MSAEGMLSPFLFWMPRFPNSWWITTFNCGWNNSSYTLPRKKWAEG